MASCKVWRIGMVAVTLSATSWAAAGTASPAGAEPAGEPVLCTYTMSDPQVVDVSGTPMVSATLAPAACTGTAKPTFSQVCLSTRDSVGWCAELPGYTTARVYFSPYTPGTSYTAKGRGCATQLQPPTEFCSSVGPRTVTL
jgi:hypothetical protein